jgi:5-methylcytosine-specific restriction endonuclease McrA
MARDKKRKNATQRRYRAGKKEKGECESCILKSEYGVFCKKHWFKDRSVTHTGTVKNWELLKQKLEDQNFQCYYTGELLIIGENASVDHRTPLSREGKTTMDNVVWCTIKINILKGDSTEDEFYDRIDKICEIRKARLLNSKYFNYTSRSDSDNRRETS